MAAATATVSLTIPTSDTKAQEVYWIARTLALAAEQIRSAGGAVTSGTVKDGSATLATWSYSAGASS
jgi:hypothetical protein